MPTPSKQVERSATSRKAVVSYALSDSDKKKRYALEEGIRECATELVVEHDLDAADLEGIWEEALSSAETEIELRERYKGGDDREGGESL